MIEIIEICHICGEPTKSGIKQCDCWKCGNCNEWFSDRDMMGNAEQMLCLHCEDLRYQTEMAIEID